MADFFRFIIAKNDSMSGRPQGIFQALFDLNSEGKINDYDYAWYNRLVAWFDKNLEGPTNFSRSKNPRAKTVGLCWYKSNAHEHINKMYDLVQFLNHYHIEVEILKSNKPGYIVYEDSYQIVAEPFIETVGRKLK